MPPAASHERIWDGLFVLGLLGAVGFVLWLPLFPTGDGPVHLYYAHVLESLLRHEPMYAQDYAIRHLFAPYLVHYLALILLEHFFSPAWAEKLFIAIIFVTTACGFRFLARALGSEAGVACVWMLPLLFSWSLGGGFLNCCFATGVTLWALGVWTLLGRSQAGRGRLVVAFASLLVLLVLSHPVPLMVLLLFTAADALLQMAARVAGPRDGCRGAMLWQGCAWAMTAIAFLVPVMLAQKGQAAAVLPGVGLHADVLMEMLTGMRLGLFAGMNAHTLRGWFSLVARVSLIAIVPGVILLLIPAKRELTARGFAEWIGMWLPARPATRLLLISLVYLGATAFFPRSLNNSFFFPQRMWDIVWLLVLACGAAATLTPRVRLRLGMAGIVAILLAVVTGFPALVTIARAQQELAEAPLPTGKRGLFLEPDSATEGSGAPTTYPVYFWSGARAFDRSHAILLNSPWLGLTILPLREMQGSSLAANSRRGMNVENPAQLYERMRERVDKGSNALEAADFFLYAADPRDPAAAAADTEKLLQGREMLWTCASTRFYTLCTRRN